MCLLLLLFIFFTNITPRVIHRFTLYFTLSCFFSVLTFSVLGSFLLFVSMRLDAHIRFSSFIPRFIHIHSYDRMIVHSSDHIFPFVPSYRSSETILFQYSYHVGFYVGSSVHSCTAYPRKYNLRAFQY